MADSLRVPVSAGLAIGVAFIILFSIVFEMGHHAATVRIRNTDNGLAFQPQVITVLSGVNNTVRWVNESERPAMLEADDETDPAFYNATKDFVLILPHKSYEFTFQSLGKIGYHGTPEQRGSVTVLHALPVP